MAELARSQFNITSGPELPLWTRLVAEGPRLARYRLADGRSLMQFPICRKMAYVFMDGMLSDACPACFRIMLNVFQREPKLVRLCRKELHGFWDACVGCIVQEDGGERSPRARKLVEAALACPYLGDHRDVIPIPSTQAEVFRLFMSWVFAFLALCLPFNDRGPIKFHRNRAANLWPMSPEQLTPRGPGRTVAALVDWTCRFLSPDALLVLQGYISGIRAYAFPELLRQTVREKVVWFLARLLLGDFSTPLSEWPGEEPCPLAAAGSLAAGFGSNRDFWAVGAFFVTVLLNGQDTKPDDGTRLVRGYEAALFGPAQHALRMVDENAHARAFVVLRGLVLVLHKCALRPDAALDPRVRRYLQSLPHRGEFRDVPDIMALFFLVLRVPTACAGPGCGVRASDACVLRRCARCGVPAYCGRACQRADWATGLAVPRLGAPGAARRIAHKRVCPALVRMSAVAPPTLGLDAFASAFARAAADLDEDDLEALVDYALATRALPADVAIGLTPLGIFDGFTDDDYKLLELARPEMDAAPCELSLVPHSQS